MNKIVDLAKQLLPECVKDTLYSRHIYTVETLLLIHWYKEQKLVFSELWIKILARCATKWTFRTYNYAVSRVLLY